MGIRFRKSFKIAPGVKFNLNKKSAGVTLGGKGVHYTINTKGQSTKSVGIPGSGLYYTETENISGKSSSKNERRPAALLQIHHPDLMETMDAYGIY